MRVKVLSSFSVSWLPTAPLPGAEIEVSDFRESHCVQLRAFAGRTPPLVEVLEPQVRPNYGAARAEVSK